LNYQKRKNKDLFKALEIHEEIQLSSAQNYIPIYTKFFALNETNYNSVNLNHPWALHKPVVEERDTHKMGKEIKKKEEKTNDEQDEDEHDEDDEEERNKNIFPFMVKNCENERTRQVDVFLKMAPLLNPFKYLVGKYSDHGQTLFNLPAFNGNEKVHPSMLDPNNSAYVDGHFTFLTSTLIHKHGFIHGVDYYGAFLGLKNNFMVDVIDDLDYLVESEFFNKHKGGNNCDATNEQLFTIEDYSHLMVDPNLGNKLNPLKIHNASLRALSVTSIHDDLYEDLFETPTVEVDGQEHLTLHDLKELSLEMVDFNVEEPNEEGHATYKQSANNKASTNSSSSCSSRTSHTNSNDIMEEEEEGEENKSGEDDENQEKEQEEEQEEDKEEGKEEGKEEDKSEWDDCSSSKCSSFMNEEEEKLYATINKFPVQVIAMECCDDTLDNLILTSDLTNEEWIAALMQIIMILITYQQVFSFTHNDLHTNNIMYNDTNEKYIYYLYKKQYYKVPTFGRVFKIIDYGRSIYKCNGQIFCSDSFQSSNDASTQYNTEPYFNSSKPRLDPNYSFDLCRLACSMFDFVVNNLDDIKDVSKCEPHVRIINEWCLDDNNINMLYKTNGAERYPGFKLYKMIARCVHKHVPKAQLERPEFAKFLVSKSNVKRSAPLINIDDMPSYA
jgi:archaellum component FlaD/FlaE